MIYSTPDSAFTMFQSPSTKKFTPILYGRRQPIWACTAFNFEKALENGQKWLVQETQRTLRELAKNGWGVQPLPIIEPGPLSQLPDDAFEDYYGE